MTDFAVSFVCPRCKGPLNSSIDLFTCRTCQRAYPVRCGIPDFRLDPDPYIGIEADRAKGERLAAEGRTRTFEELLRYYYAVTPEDPADLAEGWIAHALSEVDIAASTLRGCARDPGIARSAALLDIGCSTAALLVAASRTERQLVGVDVAFRWLVVGQVRLREAGVHATLVCANAEHLPFTSELFGLVTMTDVLEHVRDAGQALREAYRVSSAGATTMCTANNRYAPIREPNVHLWGVGYLPRRWQRAWVARRRADLHPYAVRLTSARELRRLFRASGYDGVRVAPSALYGPHVGGRLMQWWLGAYNAARMLPIVAGLLRLVGPRLSVCGTRPPEAS